MPLCQRCSLLTISELVDNDILFHPNLASLKSSAGEEQGCCDFCSLCWKALLKVIDERRLNNLLQGESAWDEGEQWTPTIWLRGWHFYDGGRHDGPGAEIHVSCGVSLPMSYDGEREPNTNPAPSVGARLEVYKLPGQPRSKYKAVGQRTTLDQNHPELYIQWIRSRLDNCRTNHKACSSGSSPDDDEMMMPTRVIDVGDDSDSRGFVRLVPTSGMRNKYIALSYCWGSDTVGIPTLSRGTYTAMTTQGVRLSELAKTHREVVLLAHGLGIRYVWIDALCIIQGDVADWEHESRTMARVYGNAILTVIAGRSAGTKDGFVANSLLKGGSEAWCQLLIDSSAQTTLAIGLCRSKNIGPTSGRGWCFQERKLSRRAVIFGEEQLSFHCVTENAWEDGETRTNLIPAPLNKPSGAASLTRREQALKEWYKTVFQFTQCALSNPHDIFAASTALAQQTLSALDSNSRYLAGIWECDMARGLLWRPCYHFTNVRSLKIPATRPKPFIKLLTQETGSSSTVTRAPSWSWAAVEGPVGQVEWNPVQVARHRDAANNLMIRPKYTNPERWSLDERCGVDALHMPACELEFIGRAVDVRVLADPSVAEYIAAREKAGRKWTTAVRKPAAVQCGVLLGKRVDVGDDAGTVVDDGSGGGWGHVVGVGLFDVADERDGLDHVWCLPVVSDRGLMLSRNKEGKFRRLGWFLHEQQDWFSRQEEGEVCLY